MGIFSNAKGRLTKKALKQLNILSFDQAIFLIKTRLMNKVYNNIAPDFLQDFFFLFSLMSLSRLFPSLRRANRYVGRHGSTPGKPPDTPASRTCLVSHVASAGLETTPDRAVR